MHEHYFKLAAEVAKSATCTHAKCGSIIVSTDNMVIGRGFDAPPLELESQLYCDAEFDMSIKRIKIILYIIKSISIFPS